MTYELLHLGQIVDALLNGTDVKTVDIQELKAAIKNESARILESIQHNVSCLEPEKGRAYLIQHQKAVCVMLDELEEETGRPDRIQIAMQYIVHLLTDLERYFPFYFDYQTPVPQTALKKTGAALNGNITAFSEILASSGVEEDTVKIFETLFKQLLLSKRNLTYHQTIYLEFFFEALKSEFTPTGKPIETLDIILSIVSHNFNHPAFYHLACRYFSREIEKCENMNDQYRTLNFLKKTIQQVFRTPASPYNQILPPIDESLLRYLKAELGYLKSLEMTAEDLSSGGLLEKNFKVTFTVRQLAIFIHLQVEAEIIIAQSPKALHQYVTRHYSTPEQDKISEKSFKNAYYENAGKDIEKVIDKIVTMLALAQEKY